MRSVNYKFIDTLLGRALVAECTEGGDARVCYASFPKAKLDEEYISELHKLYPTASEAGSLSYETEVFYLVVVFNFFPGNERSKW